MGQGVMRRPPQYCNGFIDRYGKARWYFRRAGFKRMALPGLPWSPEFMAAYEAGAHRHGAHLFQRAVEPVGGWP
jgi:hypothetical protein